MRKVTIEGSKALFYYVKAKLRTRHEPLTPHTRVTNMTLCSLLDKNPDFVSNWKKGKVVLRRIEDYSTLASALDISIKELYDIASGQLFPPECEPHRVAINKRRRKRDETRI